MHVLTVIRSYLGIAQIPLAKAAGVSQCDLSETETRPPYGYMGKYQRITNHELDVARKMTDSGERYVVCCISSWGTAEQQVQDIPFSGLQQTYRIDPCYYFCRPKPKPRTEPISGLAYFRLLHNLKQSDMTQALNIPQCDWSLYETGKRSPSIDVYLRASDLLDATVDQLLAEYPAPPAKPEVSNG